MIVQSIRVRNFLSHADSVVRFDDAPMWLICGENGAGKSALFDALEYALYGSHRGGDQNAQLLVKQGTDRATIVVEFELDGARYRLTHDINSKNENRGGRP